MPSKPIEDLQAGHDRAKAWSASTFAGLEAKQRSHLRNALSTSWFGSWGAIAREEAWLAAQPFRVTNYLDLIADWHPADSTLAARTAGYVKATTQNLLVGIDGDVPVALALQALGHGFAMRADGVYTVATTATTRPAYAKTLRALVDRLSALYATHPFHGVWLFRDV